MGIKNAAKNFSPPLFAVHMEQFEKFTLGDHGDLFKLAAADTEYILNSIIDIGNTRDHRAVGKF